MREKDDNLDTEIRAWQEKLFSRSIRRGRELARVEQLVGGTINLQCVEVSAGDGVISSRLRRLGGSWKTVTPTSEAARSIKYCVNESVTVVKDGKLPYEDASLDRLVIIDALKYFENDYEFLHECHRVLKNDGWVIIHETRRAPSGLVAALKGVFGSSAIKRGAQRNGYKATELFDKLKDGFDVPETIVYSNGLFESAATIGEAVQKSLTHQPYWLVRDNAGMEDLRGYSRLNTLATFTFPIYWLLSQLEFLPGHKMMVKSRRRPWRPRLQPKLIDGRSIAEAAINTKIGTAAPF